MKNNKTKYQAVVTDFDWTLIYEQKKINEETREKVIQYLKKGYPFIVVTGRPLFTLLPLVEKFGFVHFPSFHMVTYNGAVYYNNQTQQTFYDARTINSEEVKALHELLKPLQINLLLYYDEAIHLNEVFDFLEKKNSIDSLPLVIQDNLIDTLHRPVIKAIAASDEEKLKKVLPILKEQFPSLDFFFSQKFYIEIVKKGINKGEILPRLSKDLAIPLEQFVAFGDSDNDIPMLKKCGLSITLENGRDSVKKISNRIIGDVSTSAFGEALESLFDL